MKPKDINNMSDAECIYVLKLALNQLILSHESMTHWLDEFSERGGYGTHKWEIDDEKGPQVVKRSEEGGPALCTPEEEISKHEDAYKFGELALKAAINHSMMEPHRKKNYEA